MNYNDGTHVINQLASLVYCKIYNLGDENAKNSNITFKLNFLFTGGVLYSDQTGNFISIDEIEVSEDVTLPAGSNVEFLGVIDVLTSVASSGRLATFQYNGNIYNADASLFEEPNEDLNFFLLSPKHMIMAAALQFVPRFLFWFWGNIDFSNIDSEPIYKVKSGNKIVIIIQF